MKTSQAVAVIGVFLAGTCAYLYFEYKATEEFQFPGENEEPGEPAATAKPRHSYDDWRRSKGHQGEPRQPAPPPRAGKVRKPREPRPYPDRELAMEDSVSGSSNLDTPEFRSCVKDDDCVAIRQSCSGWTPVNLEHKGKAYGIIHNEEMRSSCRGHGTDKHVGKAKCVAQLCEAAETD